MDESLVRRNTVEVVEPAELTELCHKSGHPTVYCGYETSGPVHIGHMMTVQKLLDFQSAGFKVKVLFADIHTGLNRKGSEDWIAEMVGFWKECFVGLGLNKAEFVRGSDFQYNREYVHDVLDIAQKTTLNRALRSMQEVARDMENAHTSQVIYPLMQIADIKHLNADVAYGGLEQRKIHMLAREILPEVGYRKPVIVHTPLLCSLKGPESKMSSSVPDSLVAIDEAPESIASKMKKAYCPPTKESNPVLDIVRYLIFPRKGTLTVERPEKFGGNTTYQNADSLDSDYVSGKLHPADLKTAVAKNLAEILEPAREHLKKKGMTLPKQKTSI
ncbi:Tyrosine--tRNA ligase [uncultured archaeon]|nr:Tyrosine--tRNA ligase [uncultured archaeon]